MRQVQDLEELLQSLLPPGVLPSHLVIRDSVLPASSLPGCFYSGCLQGLQGLSLSRCVNPDTPDGALGELLHALLAAAPSLQALHLSGCVIRCLAPAATLPLRRLVLHHCPRLGELQLNEEYLAGRHACVLFL